MEPGRITTAYTCPLCHAERSEASGSRDTEMLRCAQHDTEREQAARVTARGTSRILRYAQDDTGWAQDDTGWAQDARRIPIDAPLWSLCQLSIAQQS